jgi:hypothetical protein
MRVTTLALLASLTVPACFGQLTPEQKVEDFNVLAALFDKYYGLYEWKKQAFGFDMLKTAPWLDRVKQSKTDLDFYEICVEYVAALQDSHSYFSLPSDFVARLNIGLDIYDGKVLIDGINRTLLPAARFPFAVGDELVSVDGVPVEQLVDSFGKYIINANPRATRRYAAALIAIRPQELMPHAVDVGATSTLVIRRMSGAEETYILPWTKTGTPLRVGPVPSPKAAPVRGAARIDDADVPEPPLDPEAASLPSYEQVWRDLQRSEAAPRQGVIGYGSRNPYYALPAGFTVRLGTSSADFFVSGTYQNSGQRIGYIRIPNYGSLAASVQAQFDREITFFQQNTDGLVIDQTRNTGGYLCFGENVATRLIPTEFRPIGYQLRASRVVLLSFYNQLQAARAANAEQWMIDLYESLYRQMNAAYSENRGMTGPLPLCGGAMTRQPATDSAGRPMVYTKPLVMLIDEFSTSTGDSVPAMLQDAGRGVLVGLRTNGAGGTNTGGYTGAYSEGFAGLTLGIMVRKGPVSTPEYPSAPFIENIGVRPDIQLDYMTRDNLLQQGRPFVTAFTEAIVNAIRTGAK